MAKIKWVLVLCLVATVFYTRFVGVDWGLPYTFHPDERNIAVAVSQLTPWRWFKPDFFAYGQLTIYLAYLLGVMQNILLRKAWQVVSPEQAMLLLRLIAAAASVATVYFAVKLVALFSQKEKLLITDNRLLTASLFLTFSPALIQFAHFGTTESVLMFLYTVLIYQCLLFIRKKEVGAELFMWMAVTVGAAAATKISAASFALVPIVVFLLSDKKHIIKNILLVILWGEIVFLITFLLSPYTFLSFKEFFSSLQYESGVATGSIPVFYTRIFFMSVPVLYQLIHVFPYALGWPVFIAFLAGFIFLPWSRNYNILRLSFLIYFLSQVGLFAKWTRFMAPVFPVMILIAVLFLLSFRTKVRNLMDNFKEIPQSLRSFGMTTVEIILILVFIIPGISYLSIYQYPDVRFQASQWIYKNIPDNSYILSETANVVDIPITPPHTSLITRNYEYISFNFYDLEENPILQKELSEHLQKADYIFVLSRRVFANHTCFTSDQLSVISDQKKCQKLKEKYPRLNDYYQRLFSEDLGFKKIAEFTSYPRFFSWEFPDEQAEETWTVFDHPVVRIYKRI